MSGADSGAPESMYIAREKIYPRQVSGRFQTLRHLAVWVLLGLYYCVPWLTWGDRQAVLFDLAERKFYIFGLVFWPQDFFYLSWLLIIAALALFFFTAVAGRLWCGFACPQTVWTEVFIWMERWVEGDRNQQIKRDRAGWSRDKLIRKTLKQTLWITFALFTGFTFIGYFSPIREVAVDIAHLQLGPWQWFWGIFYSFATYGNAGFLREQVCLYMCPYARFQSAMIDADTLVIAYDAERGEPRGRKREGATGDCVDCTLCVQVCPTGIDIRDGLQYQCIGCAACVDVCDSVMVHLERPKGLIGYRAEHKQPRLLRPRTIGYGVLLLALVVGFLVSVGSRTPSALDVIRDRQPLYLEAAGNRIENVYSLRLMNKTEMEVTFELTATGFAGLELITSRNPVTVPPGQLLSVPVRLSVPEAELQPGINQVAFSATPVSNGAPVTETSTFFAPVR